MGEDGGVINSYANYTCTVFRQNSINAQGEKQIYEITQNALSVFLSLAGKDIQTARGWIRLYDALGFVDKSNLDDYIPHIGDRWTFSDDDAQYEITRIQPLRGMGKTNFGFRVELKSLTEVGIIT